MKNDNKTIFNIAIFIGGNAPEHNILPWNVDFCIAADAGVLLCKKLGYAANIIIGDFDTVSREIAAQYFPKAEHIEYSTYKDETDTELALLYAYETFKDKHIDISLIGGEGGEVEHFLDIIMRLCASKYFPNRIITKTQQIEVFDRCFCVCLPKQTKISFFALGNTPSIQTSKGLEWNLDNIHLSYEKTSSSNVSIEEKVYVEVSKGRLIAIWGHNNMPQYVSKHGEIEI